MVMAIGDELFDDGEIGERGVFVGTLLGCPTENVEGEIWVGLGF